MATNWRLLQILFVAFWIGRLLFTLYTLSERRRKFANSEPDPRSAKAKTGRSVKTLAVLGSGGHTAELLAVLGDLDRQQYRPLVYVRAQSDGNSAPNVVKFESTRNNPNYAIRVIPRSREVAQNWLSSAVTTGWALLFSAALVVKEQPDVVICNGPGTCVPICWAAFLTRVLLFRNCKIVFVESFCRVQTLSLSGRLLRPICDRFVVQWPQLTRNYSDVQFLNRIC